MESIDYRQTPTQIKAELKRKVRDGTINNEEAATTLEGWEKLKRKIKSDNARKQANARLWKELLTPLRAEIKNVHALLRYSGGEARQFALELLLEALTRVLGKMELDARAATLSPMQKAKAKGVPNKGLHWSDWVGRNMRESVEAAFDAIPKAGRKVKMPFERVLPVDIAARQRQRLADRTNKELLVAKLNYEASKNTLGERLPFEEQKTQRLREKVQKIKQALTYIENLGTKDVVPMTWHGFFEGEDD